MMAVDLNSFANNHHGISKNKHISCKARGFYAVSTIKENPAQRRGNDLIKGSLVNVGFIS
jgi:hypothetical protein